MQSVLVLVLAAAIGLAEVTDINLRQSQIITLGTPITDGPVTFSLPAHWKIGSAAEFGATAHRAIDPSDDSGRTITVIVQQVDHLMPPLIYLQRTDLLPRTAGDVIVTPITLKGFPTQTARWVTVGDDGQSKSEICCCVMLPSRQALTIRLERNETFQSIDQILIQQILNAVTISGPGVTHGESVPLTGGARINPPADFAIYPEVDPLQTDRCLVRQTTSGGWVSANCVPMLMGNLPASSLRGALMALDPMDGRDPVPTAAWLSAEVDQLDANHWKIDPHDDPDGWLHRRAYVAAGAGGQGVLILLTAQTPATEADLDQAYADLQNNIHPAGSGSSADSLLADGATAISAAAAITLPAPSGQHWWLWSRQGIVEGSTRSYLDPTGQLLVRETLRRDWEGLVLRIDQRWGLGQSPSGIWGQTSRYDSPDQPTFVTETRLTDRIMTTIHLNGQDTPVVVPLTPAMVSGARLPDWLPRLASTGAPEVAVWTDRFPGADAEPLPSPILLLLRPLPATAAERGVEVEINGTGQLSRWFFAPDGTLRRAEFPGDATLLPSTESEIDSATQADPRLTPPRQQPTMDSGPQQ
jgi:hypothetical protein